jgi:hypothetical protein
VPAKAGDSGVIAMLFSRPVLIACSLLLNAQSTLAQDGRDKVADAVAAREHVKNSGILSSVLYT